MGNKQASFISQEIINLGREKKRVMFTLLSSLYNPLIKEQTCKEHGHLFC